MGNCVSTVDIVGGEFGLREPHQRKQQQHKQQQQQQQQHKQQQQQQLQQQFLQQQRQQQLQQQQYVTIVSVGHVRSQKKKKRNPAALEVHTAAKPLDPQQYDGRGHLETILEACYDRVWLKRFRNDGLP